MSFYIKKLIFDKILYSLLRDVVSHISEDYFE